MDAMHSSHTADGCGGGLISHPCYASEHDCGPLQASPTAMIGMYWTDFGPCRSSLESFRSRFRAGLWVVQLPGDCGNG